MIIAVNTRFLLEDYLEGYGNFIMESFRQICIRHPEHRFLFIFDRPFPQHFIPASNVEGIVTGPPARHPLLWKLWYDVKVPALLKKHKADLFVSCDGFCSLHTKIPQCLVVHDLAFRHFPAAIPKSTLLFYNHYTPQFLNKAARVATVSEFSKRDIMREYKTPAGKIDVVYNGVKDIFKPLREEEKALVRKKYSAGKEYFLCAGSIHPRKNLLALLKAFSLFKKRQQTGMKLVLAGRLAWKNDSLEEDLKTYKYRQDVLMTGYLPDAELAALTGAAWGMVYPSLWEGFGVPVLEAMRSAVPVITSAGTAMEEIAGNAALYADPHLPQDIADKMMLLYKDERLRKELIEKGTSRVQLYSWERTGELLWKSMEEAAAGKVNGE